MATQEQGKLFMAYADLEVAKKRAPTDKHIELAMEQLEMDMGVPGMCYTRKEILRGAPPPEEGEEEPHGVERGDTVTCHAAGFLQQGNNNFWSTRTRRTDENGDEKEGEPFEYIAGRGKVIRGWDMGVMGMKVGEVRALMVPAKEAYKEEGYPRWGIPPNADLRYEIEVLSIVPKPPLHVAALGWCGGPWVLGGEHAPLPPPPPPQHHPLIIIGAGPPPLWPSVRCAAARADTARGQPS